MEILPQIAAWILVVGMVLILFWLFFPKVRTWADEVHRPIQRMRICDPEKSMHKFDLALDPSHPEYIRPPSKFMLIVEGLFFSEIIANVLAELGWFRRFSGTGDGHTVMVIPGFLTDDTATIALRRFIRNCGYDVHGWKCGLNLGFDESLKDRLVSRVRDLYERQNRKISIVGWSLGGVDAQALAREVPHMIRCVISMGSPISKGGLKGVNPVFLQLHRIIFHKEAGDEVPPELVAYLRGEIAVPATSIYSAIDGIVSGQACIREESDMAENIPVVTTHMGMGFNPLVFKVLADRLSQPEGKWRPYKKAC